jgi:hypothetical protein
MRYAILEPGNPIPLAWVVCDKTPTIEQLACQLAYARGFQSIEDMVGDMPNLMLGYAVVH